MAALVASSLGSLSYSGFTLVVYQSTMAKKILFDTNKKITGVLVDTEGREYILSATKEVILTAGVFGSPQLLLISGVGPAATLQQHGIPVIADRPGVGQNMQDHVYFGLSYRVNVPTFSSFSDPGFAAQVAKDFNEKAAGLYTSPTTDVLAWGKVPQPLHSSLSNSTLAALATYPADWPELEYLAVGAYLGYQENLVTGDPNDGYDYASLAVATVAPRSRGYLTIASADSAVSTVISPNWMTDPTDVEVAVAGFKRARAFWQTEAMRSFRVGDDEAFPGLQKVQTDAQIEDIIRKSLNTIYHAACTCAMGRSDDVNAVIDSHARVIGVEGLRVVDASSFPLFPPGHPQATVCELFPPRSFWSASILEKTEVLLTVHVLPRCTCGEDGVRYFGPVWELLTIVEGCLFPASPLSFLFFSFLFSPFLFFSSLFLFLFLFFSFPSTLMDRNLNPRSQPALTLPCRTTSFSSSSSFTFWRFDI